MAPEKAPEPVITSSINSLKANDEKGPNGEVIAEKESFNSSRVINFLRNNGVFLNNGTIINDFEQKFSIDLSQKLCAEGNTATEKMVGSKLDEAKKVLAKYNVLDLMGEQSDSVVQSKLDSLKTPPTNMTALEAGQVMKAFEYHSAIRDYCKRMLMSQEKTSADMKQAKKEVGFMASIKEKLGDARDNWDKWTPAEKLAFGGIALVGAIMLFKSKNEYVAKAKEYLITGLEVGGGLWLANKGVELVTGHSALDMITDRTKASTGQAKFYVDNFKTDEEGANILSSSFVKLADSKFVDLLDKYDKAKKDNSHKIEGTKMKPDEAYRALDIFCSRFGGADVLKKQYEKRSTPISYSEAVVDQMARDPEIKLADGIATRVYNEAADKFKEGYNYLAATGPALWMGQKYRSWFGKDPSKEELDAFNKKFNNVVKDEAGYVSAIENNLAANNLEAGKQFKETTKTGVPDVKYNLKHSVNGDYAYVVVERNVGTKINDNKFLDENLKSCVSDSEAFLANKYNTNVSSVAGKSEVFGSIFIVDSTTMRYLVRYKIK